MAEPALTTTSPAPLGQSIGADGPHPRDVHPMSAPSATVAQPTFVLICVEDIGVREMISLLLADAGCAVAAMDVWLWLAGNPIAEPPPEVLILDAWPLRHVAAAAQAYARLAAQPAAVVLLADSPQAAQLAARLGAIATLPLLFSLCDLVTSVQQGASADRECLAASGVGQGV